MECDWPGRLLFRSCSNITMSRLGLHWSMISSLLGWSSSVITGRVEYFSSKLCITSSVAKDQEDKVRSLQNDISRMKKENKTSQKNKKMDNLFKNDKKFSKDSRTASPLSRSRVESPVRSSSSSRVKHFRSGSKVKLRTSSSRSPVRAQRNSRCKGKCFSCGQLSLKPSDSCVCCDSCMAAQEQLLKKKRKK